MTTFSDEIVTAVLAHMNGDHPEDSLLIARAFGHPDAESATMVGLDSEAGHWVYSIGTASLGAASHDSETHDLRVPWSVSISERPEIRREIVVLYDAACAKLGIEPRSH